MTGMTRVPEPEPGSLWLGPVRGLVHAEMDHCATGSAVNADTERDQRAPNTSAYASISTGAPGRAPIAA
jgi:hypothetical protein